MAGIDVSGVLVALDTVSSVLFATLPFLMALVLAWVLTELGYRYVTRRM
jgi:hypothetical protein